MIAVLRADYSLIAGSTRDTLCPTPGSNAVPFLLVYVRAGEEYVLITHGEEWKGNAALQFPLVPRPKAQSSCRKHRRADCVHQAKVDNRESDQALTIKVVMWGCIS